VNYIRRLTREKVWGQITEREWIEKSDAVVGALLELDDKTLFNKVDEFYSAKREFEITLGDIKKDETLGEDGLIPRAREKVLEDTQNKIRKLGYEIIAEIKKKLKI